MREIAKNATKIHGQPICKVIDKVEHLDAKWRDIVHLEIGDPDFTTPQHIVDAAKKSLDAGETHYGSSWCMPDFIETIAKTTHRSRGFVPDVDQVLITPCANISISYSFFVWSTRAKRC